MKKLPKKFEMQKIEKKPITVRLNEWTIKKLSKVSQENHRSLSAQISFFVDQGLSNLDNRLSVEDEIFRKSSANFFKEKV
jgi:hypothetical protein